MSTNKVANVQALPDGVYGDFLLIEAKPSLYGSLGEPATILRLSDVDSLIDGSLAVNSTHSDVSLKLGSDICRYMKQQKHIEHLKLKEEVELLRSDIQILKNKLQEQYNLDPDSHSAELEAARKRFMENAVVATATVATAPVAGKIKE